MAIVLGQPKMISLDNCGVPTPFDYNIPSDPSTTVPMTISTDEEQNRPSSLKFTHNGLTDKV